SSAIFTDVGTSPATIGRVATGEGKAGMSGTGGWGGGGVPGESSYSSGAPPVVGGVARSRVVGCGGRSRGPEFMRTYRCREGGSRGRSRRRTLANALESDVTKRVLLEICEERIECREVAVNGPNQCRICSEPTDRPVLTVEQASNSLELSPNVGDVAHECAVFAEAAK